MIVTSTEQKYQAGRLSQTEVGKKNRLPNVGWFDLWGNHGVYDDPLGNR